MFWFGAGMGGSIENNLSRWYGQFAQPDGRPSASVATRETRTVHGLNVTITRVQGRFAGGGMGSPGSAPGAREGQLRAARGDRRDPQRAVVLQLLGLDRRSLVQRRPFHDLVASFDR